LVDGLGSTRLLTDAQGQVLNAYGYEAFGETVSQSGTASNKYQYAGEQFDAALGDYYLRQRFYDMSNGRFGRMDTYEGNQQDPLTLNKYLYANGNVANNIDPTGLFSTLVDQQAAMSIRNILAGAQGSSTGYLLSSANKGSEYGVGDFFNDFFVEAVATGGMLLFSWAIKYMVQALAKAASGVDDVIRAYRVESVRNARIIVTEVGEVMIEGDGALFITFGNRRNAETFLATRLNQYPNTPSQIKSFDVPKSYYDDLKARAVPERGSRSKALRDRPIKVHPRREGDYGLRSTADIDALQRAIIQGSGTVE
jgi:RHS repeat-associated protein